MEMECPNGFSCGFVDPDNVPSWEKEFCKVIGLIPWGKVVFSKTLLDYHDNILHWDDRAGEEAFRNAKQRFWAAISGSNCDIPLPDPDLHIDRVNWNQVIDPELVKELDREYFNPDEMNNAAGTSGEPVIDDPWERCGKQHDGSLKIQDWRSTAQKDDVNDVGWGDPWELSNKHSEWGDIAKHSSWSRWEDQPNDNSDGCPQEQRFENAMFQNDKGWGNPQHSSSRQNYPKQWQLDRDANSWRTQQIQDKRGLQDRRLQGVAGNSYDRERWDHARIKPNINRSLPPRNGDHQKRGSSYTYIPRHKKSRF
ncbi:hypothetical protein MLD38_008859 [Melastoma candidum]|uniref:Uncharacterized protein n=1 Tax=Melastoma candidum TaxID=119954 RepID=A0ACB9RYR9_9MYRT|nr:hypothetical protein MLD38_008859 [Melastoma candidum]